MLRGPLVLQTFGTHWTAVASTRKIDGIDTQTYQWESPSGGGLTAPAVRTTIHVKVVLRHYSSQVKCAITLAHGKIITITTIDAAQGKCPMLLKYVNTGGSSITVTFNNDSWGNISITFTTSTAKAMQSTHHIKKIENAAKKFFRGTT